MVHLNFVFLEQSSTLVFRTEKIRLTSRADETLPNLIVTFNFGWPSFYDLVNRNSDCLIAYNSNSMISIASHNRVNGTLSNSLA